MPDKQLSVPPHFYAVGKESKELFGPATFSLRNNYISLLSVI